MFQHKFGEFFSLHRSCSFRSYHVATNKSVTRNERKIFETTRNPIKGRFANNRLER
ncbi:hypothetical protein RBSH_05822 [Rhodopirellula baltica SH28]|uniref:Uncharacterized protein n=1 Tax=Rhodopirellula baltica SH28 TaxID=993517 RepID=K5C7G3_RHOBT|nr:hypothetical protein RBSH_05822 [Rhodopirellula baltica SH28]